MDAYFAPGLALEPPRRAGAGALLVGGLLVTGLVAGAIVLFSKESEAHAAPSPPLQSRVPAGAVPRAAAATQFAPVPAAPASAVASSAPAPMTRGAAPASPPAASVSDSDADPLDVATNAISAGLSDSDSSSTPAPQPAPIAPVQPVPDVSPADAESAVTMAGMVANPVYTTMDYGLKSILGGPSATWNIPGLTSPG